MLQRKPAQPTKGCAGQPNGNSSSVDAPTVPWGSMWAVRVPLALSWAPAEQVMVWLVSWERGLQAVTDLTCRSLSLSPRFYCMDILQSFFRSLHKNTVSNSRLNLTEREVLFFFICTGELVHRRVVLHKQMAVSSFPLSFLSMECVTFLKSGIWGYIYRES